MPKQPHSFTTLPVADSRSREDRLGARLQKRSIDTLRWVSETRSKAQKWISDWSKRSWHRRDPSQIPATRFLREGWRIIGPSVLLSMSSFPVTCIHSQINAPLLATCGSVGCVICHRTFSRTSNRVVMPIPGPGPCLLYDASERSRACTVCP